MTIMNMEQKQEYDIRVCTRDIGCAFGLLMLSIKMRYGHEHRATGLLHELEALATVLNELLLYTRLDQERKQRR